MLFSKSLAHAVYVLAFLAEQPHLPIAAGTIASALGLPPEYAAKILQSLTRAGLLEAACGRRGGYRLARPLDQVTLADALRSATSDHAAARLRPRQCTGRRSPACGAHLALVALEERAWQTLAGERLGPLLSSGATPPAAAGPSRPHCALRAQQPRDSISLSRCRARRFADSAPARRAPREGAPR